MKKISKFLKILDCKEHLFFFGWEYFKFKTVDSTTLLLWFLLLNVFAICYLLLRKETLLYWTYCDLTLYKYYTHSAEKFETVEKLTHFILIQCTLPSIFALLIQKRLFCYSFLERLSLIILSEISRCSLAHVKTLGIKENDITYYILIRRLYIMIFQC